MSRETTTTTATSVLEHDQSQSNGEFAAPKSFRERVMNRGRAVLNALNGMPMTELPEQVRTSEEQKEIDNLEEAFNLPSYTPEHERPKGRLERVQSALGLLAARANLALYELQNGPSRFNRLFEKHEAYRQKHEAKEDDGKTTRVRKFLARNALELTAGAMTTVAWSSKLYLSTRGIDWDYHWKQPRKVTLGVDMAANAIEYMPVETKFSNVSVVTPGHWDGTAQGMYDAMERQGQINDQNMVIKNQYSAEMANPFMPGDVETTEQSIAPAVRNIVDMYNKTPKDVMFTSYAFSEGAFAGNRAAWEIINANGGVKPDNFQFVAYGAPMGPTGIQNNAFVNLAKPIANIYVPLNEKPAPGTIFITNQNDIIGNGANQSGLASLLMTADFAHAHNLDVEAGNQNYTAVVYGEDGVITKVVGNVHPIAELLAHNNGIVVTPTVNRVLQDLVPINDGTKAHIPQPNAHDAITAIGEQIGHDVGNPAGAQMVANNADKYYGQALQSGAEAVNNIPTQIASGDLQGAAQSFNTAVHDAAEAAKPENVVNFTRDTIVDGGNQAVQNLVPPEQRAAVQPWVDAWNNIVTKVAGDLNANMAAHRAARRH